MKILINYFVCCVVLMAVAGCSAMSDSAGKEANRQREAFAQPVQQPVNASVAANAEHIQSSLQQTRLLPAQPAKKALEPRFKGISPLDTERICISFAQANPRDILQSLAHVTGLNLMIPPALDALMSSQHITAEYHERSPKEILEATCRAVDVAWELSDGTIFIKQFRVQVFHLDFLGGLRSSSFNVGGDVLGGTSGGGNNNVASAPLTGSFEVKGQTDQAVTDIYTGIEQAVGGILGVTSSTSRQTVSGAGLSQAGGQAGTQVSGNRAESGNLISGASASSNSSAFGGSESGHFYLNRQTGLLTVSASPSRLEEIGGLVESLKALYSKEVLIEAKLLEVELSEGSDFGIDWRQMEINMSKDALQAGAANVNIISNIVSNTISNNFWDYGVTLSDRFFNINTVFKALQSFGKVKTLSNPRLKALNGQPAIISVGQSVSYLKSLDYDTETAGDVATRTANVELGSIFDGVLLGVTPIIEQDGTVTLHIVPIKTDIIGLDERQFGDSVYTFPRVNLREASTVARAKQGEIVVLGGLIHEKTMDEDFGVPYLSDLPVLGKAFKSKVKQKKLVELVIVMQLKINQRV